MDEIVINYGGLELTVRGRYERGRTGNLYARNGDPGIAPEPPDFYVDKVFDVDGKDITSFLSTEEFEIIINKVLEKYEDY